jgi:hypothetical protein
MKKQHLTESEIMRKYSNIVAEAEQLNEGMMDTLKQYAAKLMKVLDPATLKQIATTVKQATGGDYSLTRANAQKVAQALGVPENAGQMSEEEMRKRPGVAISPTLGGKIIQALHLGTIGAAIPLATATGGISLIVGGLALLMTGGTWGTEAGDVGSEYEISGDPLHRQEIRPKKGVTPTYDNPGFNRGGSNIT